METHQTLRQHLEDWQGEDELRAAVANTVSVIADACGAVAEIIALGPLAGNLGASRGENVGGDTQAELDLRANQLLIDELKAAPVACVARGPTLVPPASPIACRIPAWSTTTAARTTSSRR